MPWKSPSRIVVLAWLASIPTAVMGQLLNPAAQAPTTRAQGQPPSPELSILRALLGNPVTAPYAIRASRKDGKIVLAGRVGTKEAHDVAVRVAMGVTPSIDDRLVIDTAEVYRAASSFAQRTPSSFGPVNGAYATPSGSSPIFYPQPLFGRLDDPFFGFEPPSISYPPWWGIVANRKGDPYGAPVLDPDSPIGPDPGPAPPVASTPPPSPSPAATSAQGDTVEMSLDPRGVAVLRGTVPTMDDRIAVGQKVARMQGVTEVVNLLNTRDNSGDPDVQPTRPRDVPPPPPVPAEMPDRAPAAPTDRVKTDARDDPAAGPNDDGAVGRRLEANLARRPALAGLAVKAGVRDGVAYLSGKVPSALEAMAAYRAAQQTIGVSSVVDRLEFAVPDGQKENPLIAKGRPEDVEPYLEAQIRRQVGDRAHIDRVRVTGDRLDVRGSVARETDKPGVEAVLRSMPLLRGFALEATLVPE